VTYFYEGQRLSLSDGGRRGVQKSVVGFLFGNITLREILDGFRDKKSKTKPNKIKKDLDSGV
jgi:hypothetical protein